MMDEEEENKSTNSYCQVFFFSFSLPLYHFRLLFLFYSTELPVEADFSQEKFID